MTKNKTLKFINPKYKIGDVVVIQRTMNVGSPMDSVQYEQGVIESAQHFEKWFYTLDIDDTYAEEDIICKL